MRVDIFRERFNHYMQRFFANGRVPLPPCPTHGPDCWEPK